MKDIETEAINPKRGCVGYLSQLTYVSKTNRNIPTEAEKKLWVEVLRKKQTGHIFLRQKPIFRFIADFYCSKLRLAIEIDGGSHIGKMGRDKNRDKFLKQIGIDTIRFSNKEVINNIDEVKNKILSLVKGRNGVAERD